MIELSDLRPVGTTWHEHRPPLEGSTDPRGFVFTWRVKEHVKYARYPEDDVGEWGESVECVDVEYVDVECEDLIQVKM